MAPRDWDRRSLRATALLCPILAVAVSCSHAIAGTAVYAPENSGQDGNPVAASALSTLVLPITDLEALAGVSDLSPADVLAVRALPDGVLSDVSCGAVMQAGWLATYVHSGHVGAQGVFASGPRGIQVSETVAAFRAATAAQAFVRSVIAQWTACIERPITQTIEGVRANFMGFGPSRAYDVYVLLVRSEGGRGFACGRAIAAERNVTADVTVCGQDETVVTDQAAHIVNATWAKIPA